MTGVKGQRRIIKRQRKEDEGQPKGTKKQYIWVVNDNGEALKSDEAALKGDKEALKGDEEASKGQGEVLNSMAMGKQWGSV